MLDIFVLQFNYKPMEGDPTKTPNPIQVYEKSLAHISSQFKHQLPLKSNMVHITYK
jgi:hypothetical protein